MNKKTLTAEQSNSLLKKLKTRFENNRNRHEDLVWDEIEIKLLANPEKLWSLHEMEITGGDPDVIAKDNLSAKYLFCDCSAESPVGRRSLCYDRDALESRNEYKPENNVLDMAADMGVELMSEDQYRQLQKLGNFDAKTSNWVVTPLPIRKLGGALFADYRYEQVFVYHNGAQSYYSSRGFRGILWV